MKRIDRFKVLGMAFCLSLVVLAFAPSVKADGWNKKTKVTFSEPVEIPGVGAQTLPAGTYIFKLLDSLSDRHIVQIFSEDGTHVYSTILAIPNYRLRATDKTVMTFKERAAGQPEAIRAWFYPGDNFGQEFVYPKARAIELAKITNQPVLTMPTELAAAPVEALKTAPIEAVKPTGEVVEVAQVVERPPVQIANAAPAPEAATSLPKTASPLPLVGLIGLLSLGVGATLLAVSKAA